MNLLEKMAHDLAMRLEDNFKEELTKIVDIDHGGSLEEIQRRYTQQRITLIGEFAVNLAFILQPVPDNATIN